MSTVPGFNTRAIHAGQDPDPATGAVVVPLHLATTFKQDGVGGLRDGYEYARSASTSLRSAGVCSTPQREATREISRKVPP